MTITDRMECLYCYNLMHFSSYIFRHLFCYFYIADYQVFMGKLRSLFLVIRLTFNVCSVIYSVTSYIPIQHLCQTYFCCLVQNFNSL